MRRLLVLVTGALTLLVVTASCGVGGDDNLRQFNDDDLFGLDETTTSSTSTTTSTTLAPPIESVLPTMENSTTTIVTESVKLFFLDSNRLQAVPRDLAGEATPSRVIAALEAGPPTGPLGIGLRTLLPELSVDVPPLVNAVDATNSGFATVDLAAAAFALIDPADQRPAIAQIVLTLVNRPGIGQVTFTLDGKPMSVPQKNGLQSLPGAMVTKEDYESLLLGDAASTTTTEATTTTAAPVTTVTPPPSAPAG
jgi:hypothetical protein